MVINQALIDEFNTVDWNTTSLKNAKCAATFPLNIARLVAGQRMGYYVDTLSSSQINTCMLWLKERMTGLSQKLTEEYFLDPMATLAGLGRKYNISAQDVKIRIKRTISALCLYQPMILNSISPDKFDPDVPINNPVLTDIRTMGLSPATLIELHRRGFWSELAVMEKFEEFYIQPEIYDDISGALIRRGRIQPFITNIEGLERVRKLDKFPRNVTRFVCSCKDPTISQYIKVLKYIEDIDPKRQMIFQWFFKEYKPVKQIAQKLGIEEESVIDTLITMISRLKSYS